MPSIVNNEWRRAVGKGDGEHRDGERQEESKRERATRREGSIPMMIESSDVPQQWL